MAKTGIKIKRCNVGSVEAHNKRTKEYLEGLEKAGKPLYYFPDLTHNNVSWENPRYEGKSCLTLFEEMKQLYVKMVGQEPQLKDREVVMKKSGKKKIIAGWSPIREGCPPIKEDTTIEDFNPVVEWAHENGIDVIRIDLHFDEGHFDVISNTRILNRHAHIVFDWIDHETGRTIKLPDSKMSELQTKLAQALGMERGTPKAETGLEHIPAAEYREMKAAQTAKELEDLAKNLEVENQQLRAENDSLRDTFMEISSVVEMEEQRKIQLGKTNDELVKTQEIFDLRLGEILKSHVKNAKSAIEDTSAKVSLFGSRTDQAARESLRAKIISSLEDVIQNPTAQLKEIQRLPEDIRQEYRRMDEHAENNRQTDSFFKVDSPAIMRTNADLRKLYQREAMLLDEMNLQQLPEDTKDRLMEGESVTIRKKWYDPEKLKFTDEEEATLQVSDWRLRFNGESLKEFLGQVWMRMARAAQELKEAARQRFAQEQNRPKGKGLKL